MALTQDTSIPLNDGNTMPILRLGTYASPDLWCTFFSPELVRKGLEKSLQDLRLDYLDLFIMHWPFSLKVFDFKLTSEDMKTLEELDNNLRYGHFKQMKEHPEYPFHDAH